MQREVLQHVIVDGSNIATEGRDLPSLTQLDEAVQAFIREYEPEILTVVVDASFPNRIGKGERKTYEEALSAGEIITPPAGAIGRGDGFILQIADRAGATVLSNDSFQEFHGQYEWLFEPGRLIGGKPVPHVGWVFMDRSPVRGPTSRRAVSAARRPEPRRPKPAEPTAAPPPPPEPRRLKPVETTATSPSTLNDALPFIEFVGAHPVGSQVEAIVERFGSHGAYVRSGDVRAYVPLKNLGDPAPRSPKEVLRLEETRLFLVAAIDAPRRGVDLALPPPAPAKPQKPPKADKPPKAEKAEKGKAEKAKGPTKRKSAKKKAAAPVEGGAKQGGDKDKQSGRREQPQKAAAKRSRSRPKKAAAEKPPSG